MGDVVRTTARGIIQGTEVKGFQAKPGQVFPWASTSPVSIGRPLPRMRSASAEAIRYDLPATRNFPTGRTIFVEPGGRAAPVFGHQKGLKIT